MNKLLRLLLLAALALAALPALASAAVMVFPSPGVKYAEPGAQIVFRNVSPSSIGRITVVGSRSGTHAGHIAADSDGRGGSFLPDHPFTPGESVTVTTSLNVLGGSNGTFHFSVANPEPAIKPIPVFHTTAGRNGVQHFHSRGDLQPAALTVTKNSAPPSLGDIFVAPQYGPSQDGPMLLGPHGNLLWFQRMPSGQLATDFRVQHLGSQPVLTWWQGYMNRGSGRGQDEIFDQHYKQIATVKAANGLQGTDLHEFLLTPQGNAYVSAVFPIHVSFTGKPLEDAVVQEIDVKTGLVLFEWDAYDHIPVSESYFRAGAPGFVFDPYHLNSIALDHDGNLILSMRNTWAAYKVNHDSGAIMWTLGSSRSSFKLGPGVGTAFQHAWEVLPDGSLAAFDDGAGPPKKHSQSRAIRVSLNFANHTASLIRQYEHTPPLLANFEGNAQLLPNGDMFVGWGQQPYFTEFGTRGQTIFDAHFNAATPSYRAYRFPWSGSPDTKPAIAISRGRGYTTVYVSWNGATGVSAWRVWAGSNASHLSRVGTFRWRNFETTIRVRNTQKYFQIQAFAPHSHSLAFSKVVS